MKKFDLNYFVSEAIASGRMTPEYFLGTINPTVSLSNSYADAVLEAARRYRIAEVGRLSIQVDTLDGFQSFFNGDMEITSSAWLEALNRMIYETFRAKYLELATVVEEDFQVRCDCGNELHWRDDGSLSDCDRCTPP